MPRRYCPECRADGVLTDLKIENVEQYICPVCGWRFLLSYFTTMAIDEPKDCPSLTFRLLKWDEFRNEMLSAIVKHNERKTPGQLCEDLMDLDKPSFSSDNLSAFLKAMLFEYAPMAPCFIESADPTLVYFFTGTDAILFTRPKP
jgi:hypothetical protein